MDGGRYWRPLQRGDVDLLGCVYLVVTRNGLSAAYFDRKDATEYADAISRYGAVAVAEAPIVYWYGDRTEEGKRA